MILQTEKTDSVIARLAKDRAKHPIIVVALITVLLVAGAVGIYSVSQPKKAESSATPAVLTVTCVPAEKRWIDQSLIVTGTVSAWDQLSIGAEASGLRIESVPVEEGMQVKRGQVLATLNSAVLRAQLRQQEAKLMSNKAGLAKAIQPNRPEDIASLRAALSQAEASVAQEKASLVQAHANLTNAEENARRYATLVTQGAVSAQEADNRSTDAKTQRALVTAAESRIRAAEFAVAQAREKLTMAEAGGRKEDVLIATSTNDETRALIDQLKAQIDQTIIRAPDDGLLVKRDAHIGDISTAGKALFTMVRKNKIEMRAQVADVDLARLTTGQKVEIKTGKGQVEGEIWQITPTIDPQMRLGTVRISIPSESSLMPGMFVRASIDTGRKEVITVAPSAVQGQDGHFFLFKLDGTRARAQTVKTGSRTTDYIEITEGLQPGEKVIDHGAGFLSDGDTVQIGR